MLSLTPFSCTNLVLLFFDSQTIYIHFFGM